MLLCTGMTIHRNAKITIPVEIEKLMNSITELMPAAGLEYGMYLKGTWDEKTATVIVKDEWYFPKQEVTSVTITFKEEPPSPEWNVVMHRHPNGVRKFSATDESSINEEFLASILFIPPADFPDAVINIPLSPGNKLQVRVPVYVQRPDYVIPEALIAAVTNNLKQRKALTPTLSDYAGPRIGGARSHIDDFGFAEEDLFDLDQELSRQSIPRAPIARPMAKQPVIHVSGTKPVSHGTVRPLSPTENALNKKHGQ